MHLHKVFGVFLFVCGVGAATWMVVETAVTFPGRPFTELIPGYVVFPDIAIFFGVLGLVVEWNKE